MPDAAPAEIAEPDLELEVAPRALPDLFTARIVAIDGDRIDLDHRGETVFGLRDETVDAEVLRGALLRGERVLCERDTDGRGRVIGALRTKPTAGIDRVEELRVEAHRIDLTADEIRLRTKTAAVVLRAIGEVETVAERIISRAEGVHKIIGRMLRLN